jgi:DNA-binding transcriptional LysR family regulator
MELRQLEHFVAVTEEGGFGRAAERCNIVPSGLSASIRSLERELGADLFVRTTRRVSVTAAGQALLPEARRTLLALTTAREAVNATRGRLGGAVSVGLPQTFTGLHLTAILKRFHAAHPDVGIRVRQAGSRTLTEEVRAGRLDLIFAYHPSSEVPAGVSVRQLREVPMVLACPLEDPLADAEDISVTDLVGAVFLDYPMPTVLRSVVDNLFAGTGIRRNVAFEVDDIRTLLDLVAGGLGVSIIAGAEAGGVLRRLVPKGAPGPWPERPVRSVPFRDPVPSVSLALMTPPTGPASAAAAALIAAFTEDPAAP